MNWAKLIVNVCAFFMLCFAVMVGLGAILGERNLLGQVAATTFLLASVVVLLGAAWFVMNVVDCLKEWLAKVADQPLCKAEQALVEERVAKLYGTPTHRRRELP